MTFHIKGAAQMQITTIGLDIAKTVFQVHGVDGEGNVVVARQLRRGRLLAFFEKLGPCLVGMEACATSHHWARELARHGHEVRLMPPGYVKPYVKRGKRPRATYRLCASPRRERLGGTEALHRKGELKCLSN